MSEYEQRTIVEMTRQLQMRFPGVSQDICIGFAESLARVALKRWQRRPWTRPPWQSGRRKGIDPRRVRSIQRRLRWKRIWPVCPESKYHWTDAIGCCPISTQAEGKR